MKVTFAFSLDVDSSDMDSSIVFAAWDPDASLNFVKSLGSSDEQLDIAKENNWFVNGDYYPVDVQKESTISLPNISKSDLEKSVRKANLGFFLNPIFVIKNLTQIKSPNELINKLGVFKKKIFK